MTGVANVVGDHRWDALRALYVRERVCRDDQVARMAPHGAADIRNYD